MISRETKRNRQKIQDFNVSGRPSRGVLCGQDTKVPHVMRINLIIVGIQERKELVRLSPGVTLNLGDGSGHGGIAALVPRVALPTGCASALGFDSLPFCLGGPAETQQVFGLAG